jgi:tetratricopeptide (TPR) repeat protein
MKAELNRAEMDVFNARLTRQPGNDTWHYELGVRLKRAARFKEAIHELQQAGGDVRHKSQVHLELGECFQYVKQFKLALSNYEQAIKTSADKEPEVHKLALYRAGVLAMGLFKTDQSSQHLDAADNYLTELGGLDFSYRDVAERLDKISQLRNKG